MTPTLVERFFRHEYGKLVSTLSRRVGVRHIEAVEDAAQSALMVALDSWPRRGLPDDPTAWLFRVAHNILAGELRKGSRHERILEQVAEPGETAPPTWLAGSYMWTAVLSDLHRRAGNVKSARRFNELALKTAPTNAVRAVLQRRLGSARRI